MTTHTIPADGPTLPTLDPGPHLLDVTGTDDVAGPLHALVVDHLLTTGGTVHWVDSHGTAATTSLARLAPSLGTLERVRVARGFTAYQHHRLCRLVSDDCTRDTALVVCPEVDWLYRSDDVARGTAERLLASALDHVTPLADVHDCPVLFTRATVDDFTAPVRDACDAHLTCQRTRFGPRFASDDGAFETLVYPVGDGAVQTTLAYWRQVLARRHAAYATPEATATPSTGVDAGGAH